ncbi:MAG: cytochrome C oxidase subunit IV family protein [bacterium]|nr:cytochrome C oxidase subunit IV family protein [bacterium]
MSEQNHSHHVIPVAVYAKTFIALLVLTALTVLASRVDLGILNTPLALGIALVKMSVVALFFMGLKWDKGISTILFVGAGVAIFIFMLLTFADFSFRGDISAEEGSTFGIKSPVKLVEPGALHHGETSKGSHH